MFLWSPGATEVFVKTQQIHFEDSLYAHAHAHTHTMDNGALVRTQSASCRQVLTFPECLHSTCELVLPRCQSPSVYTARRLSRRDDKVTHARMHADSVSQVAFMSLDKHSLN